MRKKKNRKNTFNDKLLYQNEKREKAIDIIAYILLTIATIYYIPSLNQFFALDGDNVTYSLLARAIIEGKGYVSLRSPYQPPFIGYWPGFPLLLTIPSLLFPNNLVALKMVPFICFIIGLFFFYKYIKIKFNSKLAVLMLFLCIINPVMYHFSHTILTQAPFFCFLIISIYFVEKYVIENKKVFSVEFFIFTAATIFSKYLRHEGNFLFLAIIIYLLLKKRRKDALYFGIFYLAFISIWIIRNRIVFKNASSLIKEYYLKRVSVLKMFTVSTLYNVDLPPLSISEIIHRCIDNIKLYFGYLIPVETFGLKFLYNSFVAIIGLPLLIILGWWYTITDGRKIRNIKKFLDRITPIHIYFIFGMGIVIITIGRSTKYLYPIVPFVIFYTFMGIKNIASLLKIKKANRNILFMITVFILFFGFWGETRRLYKRELNFRYYDPAFTNFLKVAEWFKTNTPDGTRVLSRKGEYFYWYSERESISHIATTNTKRILRQINDLGFDYILLTETINFDRTTRYYIDRVISKYPQFFELYKVFKVPGTRNKRAIILRVKRDLLKQYIGETKK